MKGEQERQDIRVTNESVKEVYQQHADGSIHYQRHIPLNDIEVGFPSRITVTKLILLPGPVTKAIWIFNYLIPAPAIFNLFADF